MFKEASEKLSENEWKRNSEEVLQLHNKLCHIVVIVHFFYKFKVPLNAFHNSLPIKLKMLINTIVTSSLQVNY